MLDQVVTVLAGHRLTTVCSSTNPYPTSKSLKTFVGLTLIIQNTSLVRFVFHLLPLPLQPGSDLLSHLRDMSSLSDQRSQAVLLLNDLLVLTRMKRVVRMNLKWAGIGGDHQLNTIATGRGNNVVEDTTVNIQGLHCHPSSTILHVLPPLRIEGTVLDHRLIRHMHHVSIGRRSQLLDQRHMDIHLIMSIPRDVMIRDTMEEMKGMIEIMVHPRDYEIQVMECRRQG
jgi:hypothetical protein